MKAIRLTRRFFAALMLIFVFGLCFVVKIEHAKTIENVSSGNPINKMFISTDVVGDNISLSEFAQMFSEYSGMPVIIDDKGAIENTRISFYILASPEAELSYKEIMNKLEVVAYTNNLDFLYSESQQLYRLRYCAPRLYSGVSTANIKIYSHVTPLPQNSNEVVTYSMKLNKFNFEEITKLVKSLQGDHADYNSIATVPGRFEIAISDRVSAIKMMIIMIEKLSRSHE